MKKIHTKKMYLLLPFVLLWMTGFSQLAMTRTTFTGSFSAITSGAGGATLSTAAGDDATQDGIPIGFTFNYLGTNYTAVGVSTNGWASFATVGSSSQNGNTNMYTTTGPNLTMGPWWDDLTTDSIVYITTGTPGSQVMTIQWNAKSYYFSATQLIPFQLKLYEGTNVIEFQYGTMTPGTAYTSESASIGIEGATGGNGNYLDAVTGSAFVGQYYMQAATKWPTRFFRFTPGAPTPVAGGTYTVGIGQNYPTLNEAIADLNHRGMSGPVVLSLTQATYDYTAANGNNIFPVVIAPIAGSSSTNTLTIQPASGTSTLLYDGVSAGGINNASTTSATGTGNEPILALCGATYVNVNNINLNSSSTGQSDRGLEVINQSATIGSQNNAFTNISVQLNRANTSSMGIEQRLPTTPTAATGANSNNAYMNLSVSNVYNGINLAGNATYPDLNCVIGNSSPTAFNSIGSSTANDIGNGSSASYGIQASNQSSFNIFNNEVRNITVTGSVASDGIIMTGIQGTSSCHNNKIHTIKSTSTTSTSNITGIRSNVTSGSNSVRIYNNFIYDLSSGYTGAATATRAMRGIYVQTGGGGTGTETISVDNNNVLINAPANLSSTCFETGATAGPVINVRNNVFDNATAAQTAPAAHYTFATPSATLMGNTGSVSNYNDLYIANTTQGFVGIGATTTYATLANWQTAMSQDANSISTNPSFNSANDLHVNSPFLDGAGSTIAWVTNDIDNDVRGGTPDIGADEFVAASTDAGVTLLVAPVSGNCYSAAEQVTVRVQNFAALPLDFTTNNVLVTVNVTGQITSTLTFTINNNALNSGNPLASGGTVDVPVGTINMSAAGTYTFNSFTTMTGDGNATNDAMPSTSINYQPGTVTVAPHSLCQGSTTTLTVTGNTSSNIQWQMSTDGGLTWTNIASATTSPYVDTPADTTWYQSLMCGSLASTYDSVIFNPVTTPTTVNDTICGFGTATLSASGSGTLNWYTQPTGGSIVNTGSTYTTAVSTTTTYYVENVSGGGVSTVGLFDNSGGGAQQTSTAYNIFDVYQNCTLIGAYVYPGAAGNIVCDLLDNTGALITSRTVAVTAADVNQRTYVALNIPLTVGTGYRLAQGTGSVSMFRNSSGVAMPYTLPGTVSIYNTSAGTTYYYFFYDWQVLTGCASGRIPVDAVVIPTAPVSINASSTMLCAGDTSTLTASSSNLGYNFTWSPATNLSATTGATVMANPASTIDYIVTADSAGCVAMDTVSISVNSLPMALTTISDTIICIGQNDTLTSVIPTAAPFISTNVPVAVPDATPSGASSVINIPYALTIAPAMSMKVCMNFTHTWDGDMSFTLISPQGTQLDLSSNNGGSGDNYTGTCFIMSAPTNITAGTAPFTGQYVPEGAGGFNVYNNENTQGTWTLLMVDGASGDVGTLNNWFISFLSTSTMAWSSNPVGFTSTNDTIVVSPATTTDYILTVTDTVTGCTSNYSHTVTVRQPISLAVSGDSLICAGDTSFLNVNASGGDGNFSYNWSSGATTAMDTVMPASNTLYYITVADGCGTPSAMDSVQVDIATPVMIAGISNDTTTCTGTPLVLNVMSSGGNGNTSYNWSNGPVTAADSVTAGAAGSSMTYSVTVMDGCASTATDSVTVMVYSAPVVTVVSADTTLCSGDTIVVMATATGGDGNLSYVWSNGPMSAVDTTVTTSTTTYSVTVTDGCALTSVDSVTVSVFSPFAMTVSNDTSICIGDMLVLNSMPTGGDGNYVYTWSNGPATANDTISPATTTNYVVSVTEGCGGSAMDSVLVTVNMPPVASFTQTVNTNTVTFTNTSTNATNYTWDFGDGSPVSTQTSPSHTYTTNGNYTVVLVATNGCGSDTTTFSISIDVGIEEFGSLGMIGVYPNPANGQFNVSFGTDINTKVVIELFDLQGKLLQSQELSNVAAGNVKPVYIEGYESGVYMLRVTTVNGSRTFRVSVY